MPKWTQKLEPNADGHYSLVPSEYYYREEADAPYVQGDIEDFVSPITREMITDRGQLRRHNAKHGVTNMADYSPEFIHKRRIKREDEMCGRTPQARQERRDLISEELHKHGI